MFKHAIVRIPSPNISEGLATVDLGKPVYAEALKQHAGYIAALEACGVDVSVLEADLVYPDACFVEDTAILAERLAVITNPGAPSRKGEQHAVEHALRDYYHGEQIVHVTAPGTLEGGDVMRIGDHFFIGLSARTNEDGASQLIYLLKKHGYTGSMVTLYDMLHPKSGVAHLKDNLLLAAGEFIGHSAFAQYTTIPISMEDAYAANCINVNGTILIPAGYPAVKEKIEENGLSTFEVEVSEFRKIDGGLSCLSLRF